jgi:beta-mannanase
MSNAGFLRSNARLLPIVACVALLLIAGALRHGGQALRGIVYGGGSAVNAPLGATISYGIYDPGQIFAASQSLSIDHYFFNWAVDSDATLESDLAAAAGHQRQPLLTIEPYPIAAAATLLQDVAAGAYDGTTTRICTQVAAFGAPVLLRWGHEMDQRDGRYPWQTSDGTLYQRAYRRFVTTCRAAAPNARFIWSPAGNSDAARYWPGKQYVDEIGLSIFGYQQIDSATYGKVRSFADLLTPKYNRVRQLGRPVIVAELGVTGDATEQMRWLRAGLGVSSSRFPLLRAVVYFDAIDAPGVWGANVAVPDWRLQTALPNSAAVGTAATVAQSTAGR